MKLSRRFNSVVIPLVAFPLIALGWITYNKLYEESRDRSFSDTDSVLFQLTQRLDGVINSAISTADLLAADLTMQQYALIHDDADRYSLYQRGLLKRFRVYLDSDPAYSEIRFILPDGYEDARWGRAEFPNIDDEEGDSWWFGQLLASEKEHFCFIDLNTDTGSEALHVFRSLRMREVARAGIKSPMLLRGFIGVTVDLAAMRHALTVLAENAGLYIALLDRDGQLLLSSNPNGIVSEARLLQQFQSENSDRTAAGVDDLVVDGTRYYVDADVSVGGYSFISATPVDQIHGSARDLSLDVVLITIASILVTIAVLSIFLRKVVVRPLRELIDASNTIGAGKLGTHIDVKGDSELSELAESFNRMASELARSDEKIRYAAHHDALTRLPNRHMFQVYLNKSIAAARRANCELALLMLDIDDFKKINDSLGHDKGDELLVKFAQKISNCLRAEDFVSLADCEQPEDFVARHGGDEFTVILPRVRGPWSAAVVAQRIISSLAEDVVLDGHALQITTSIGISIYPEDGDSMESLLKCADIAMYHAKDLGKNNYQFYTHEMMDKIVERIEGEKELREAIRSDSMVLHYQPQIAGKTEEIYGFEALVRWEHPERGMIPPFKFIQLAEETGLIVELGAWVIRESCRQAAQWIAEGFPSFRISVNVSGVQMKNENIIAVIAETLQETGLPGENLTVELTESILLSGDSETWEQLRSIKDLGVTIALDDFGTGYSSLSYLRTFPVDVLKIDRSFIAEIETKDEVRAILTAIVEMAGALDLQVAAEGVEVEAHVETLKAIECDVMQGYFYSPPMAAEEAREFFREYLQRAPTGEEPAPAEASVN